jgi:sulfite reductase beta subunit-like hemoprotein
MDKARDDVMLELKQHAGDVEQFLKGELSADDMKARRVPRGIYEQRRDGTYMMRVRVPAGELSADKARALAGVASRYGGGTLHVTTRQDFQLHDVTIGDTPVVMRALLEAGLSTRGGGGNTVRNVTACPYAGLCPAEQFDVRPAVQEVTDYLVGQPGSYTLPRKYKIAFSGCVADCALAEIHDLGLVADVRAGVAGFRVYAGGGMGALSRVGDLMEEWIPAAEVVRVAEAIRRLFDRMGDRSNRQKARLRFAVERVGAEAFRALLKDEVKVVAGEGVPDAHADVTLAEAPTAAPWDYRGLAEDRESLHVVRQRQSGLVAVLVGLPLGQIHWRALEALAGVAEAHSENRTLRLTQDQKLVIPFVRESKLAVVRDALRNIFDDGIDQKAAALPISACTGAATCRLGFCLSHGAARACSDAMVLAGFKADTLRSLDIRMNGCPNACGQHPVGTIGLMGAVQRVGERMIPTYRVSLGARRGLGRVRFGKTVGTVPAKALPMFIVEVVRDFERGRGAGEVFADYYERLGADHFRSMLERYAVIPSYEAAPEFYRDWGREEAFSLAGRGVSEEPKG